MIKEIILPTISYELTFCHMIKTCLQKVKRVQILIHSIFTVLIKNAVANTNLHDIRVKRFK